MKSQALPNALTMSLVNILHVNFSFRSHIESHILGNTHFTFSGHGHSFRHTLASVCGNIFSISTTRFCCYVRVQSLFHYFSFSKALVFLYPHFFSALSHCISINRICVWFFFPLKSRLYSLRHFASGGESTLDAFSFSPAKMQWIIVFIRYRRVVEWNPNEIEIETTEE